MNEFERTMEQLWNETPGGEDCIVENKDGSVFKVYGMDSDGSFIAITEAYSKLLPNKAVKIGCDYIQGLMEYRRYAPNPNPNPKMKTYYRPLEVYDYVYDFWIENTSLPWSSSKDEAIKQAHVLTHNFKIYGWEEKEFPDKDVLNDN